MKYLGVFFIVIFMFGCAGAVEYKVCEMEVKKCLIGESMCYTSTENVCEDKEDK